MRIAGPGHHLHRAEDGQDPARRATSLATVYQAGDTNYVATVTVQTVKPDDPNYAKDSAAIIKGFQILPPKK